MLPRWQAGAGLEPDKEEVLWAWVTHAKRDDQLSVRKDIIRAKAIPIFYGLHRDTVTVGDGAECVVRLDCV